jgi:hypothetical protein
MRREPRAAVPNFEDARSVARLIDNDLDVTAPPCGFDGVS